MWYARVELPAIRLFNGVFRKGDVFEITQEEIDAKRLQVLVDNKTITLHVRNPNAHVETTPVFVAKAPEFPVAKMKDLLIEADALGLAVPPSIRKADILELIAGAKVEQIDDEQSPPAE